MERRYRGPDQRWWTVEEVRPAPGARLRDPRMSSGWLRYRAEGGEEVCVAPIPAGWTRFDEEHLEAFRRAGQHAGYSSAQHRG